MECPHCQKELPVVECPACGQKTLTGANFCHDCGHLLPPAASEGRKLLTCSTCGQHLLPEAGYCHACGQPAHEHDHEHAHDDDGDGQGLDFSKRVACGDGACIGIIGPDGKCTECGKPFDAAAAPQPEEN